MKGMNRIAERVRENGVVGAGGAGFPTHVKLDAQVEFYIVNGAECEPLLHKDKELMRTYPERIVHGLRRAMDATGARKGIVGVKAKNADAVRALQHEIGDADDIELLLLGNFYPAGDEFVLVYEAIGRLIPSGGIPLQVGAAVNNVETLLNVGADAPVVDTFVTVCGTVRTPMTVKVPLGTSGEDLVRLAGGSLEEEYVALYGGVMMGNLTDPSTPVTKTTGGIVVLPKEHPVAIRKGLSEAAITLRGKSACDQCTDCTELCPRYLLGYAIEPHKTMRSLGFGGEQRDHWSRYALLCCECSLCNLYACPENLEPKEVCARSKAMLTAQGIRWDPAGEELKPHPMRPFRRVPIERLMTRLGLDPYDRPAPLSEERYDPPYVRIPLKQHTGAPARPVVKVGDHVEPGDLIGEIPEGQLGARIHASISGRVTEIEEYVRIERG